MKPKHYYQPRQLAFPLPHRCWERSTNGLYTSRRWTQTDLKFAHQAGGWENGTQDIAPAQKS